MKFACFADDYQGLAASVLAAALGAVPDTGIHLRNHRILVLGTGPHRVCIAEMIASAISQESRGMASEARQNIFLFDNDGLVTTDSPHAEREDEEMREILLYAKEIPNSRDIDEVSVARFPGVFALRGCKVQNGHSSDRVSSGISHLDSVEVPFTLMASICGWGVVVHVCRSCRGCSQPSSSAAHLARAQCIPSLSRQFGQ